MSKELEALEEAKELTHRLITSGSWDKIEEQLDIVETALKESEELDNGLYDIFEKFGIKHRKDLLKKLKALDVIIEKEVNLHWLKNNKDLKEYNECLPNHCKPLTEEEYNLLKGVLL